MAGSAFEDDETVKLLERFAPILVADTDDAGMAAHSVRGFPTVIFTKPDGTEVLRVVGSPGVESFRDQVRRALTLVR